MWQAITKTITKHGNLEVAELEHTEYDMGIVPFSVKLKVIMKFKTAHIHTFLFLTINYTSTVVLKLQKCNLHHLMQGSAYMEFSPVSG
jgi:hypothetical protein